MGKRNKIVFPCSGKRKLPVGRSEWVQNSFCLCFLGVCQGAEQWPRWKLTFETHFPHWMALNRFIALRLWDSEKHNCNCKKRKGWLSYQGSFCFQGGWGELWLMTITATLAPLSSTARSRLMHLFPQQGWPSVKRGMGSSTLRVEGGGKDTEQQLLSGANAEEQVAKY